MKVCQLRTEDRIMIFGMPVWAWILLVAAVTPILYAAARVCRSFGETPVPQQQVTNRQRPFERSSGPWLLHGSRDIGHDNGAARMLQQ